MTETDPAFLAFLQDEEARSYDGTLLEEVETALNSYTGQPYGDEEDGRSQVVTRDVAEAIDWMVPSIARTLMSSDHIVEFEADSEEGRQHAEDATEKLHDDMRRYAYDLVIAFIKAGLLDKLGIIKSCVETKKQRVEQHIPPELLPEDLKAAGIIEATPVEGMVDENGEPAMFHVAALVDSEPSLEDYNVPLEEFRFSPDARDLETAVYLAHIVEKSISDLVEMGFAPELVEGVEGDNPNANILSNARDVGRAALFSTGNDRPGALRKVWLLEEYVRYDLNGDGIAERLCVHRVGNTILEVREVDYQPFGWWTPFPMPGRLVGHSLADKVIDIQRQTTALKRNALDSLYFSTAPGTYINEASMGDHTIDDLLTVRPGRLVRFVGAQPPIPEQRADTSGTAFEAIERLRGEAESRTGITRMNQGLDADAINKTANGTAMMQAAGQLIEDFLARNVANAIARWFRLKYKLMREYGTPFTLRVDGEFRQIDPRQWPEDMDIKVRVGLGSGRKEQRLAYRRELGQYQALLKQEQSPLVNDEVMYKNLAGLTRDMGFAPNEMFVDPSTVDPSQNQPAPDPKMLALQADLQIKQQKLQQMQQEGQAKLQMMAQRHASEEQIAQARADLEATLAVRQQDLDSWLHAQQLKMEQERHIHDSIHSAIEHEAKVKKLRSGGALNK